MLWLHFIYTVLLYSQMFAATFSMDYFTIIANLEFTEIPIKHYCCISQINCGSNCDTDEGCLAFNYNRGTNACRLLNRDLFNQTTWPEFVSNVEWAIYVKQRPRGRTTFFSLNSFIYLRSSLPIFTPVKHSQ